MHHLLTSIFDYLGFFLLFPTNHWRLQPFVNFLYRYWTILFQRIYFHYFERWWTSLWGVPGFWFIQQVSCTMRCYGKTLEPSFLPQRKKEKKSTKWTSVIKFLTRWLCFCACYCFRIFSRFFMITVYGKHSPNSSIFFLTTTKQLNFIYKPGIQLNNNDRLIINITV